MTTLHILTNQSSPVNINNRVDAFSIAAYKFIKWMTKFGWHCIHYSIPGAEVDCEMVQCLDTITQDNDLNRKLYNERAGREIALRKKPGDMILCFHGWENRAAADANPDLKIVEPSIGYSPSAVFAPYRVFVSYANMHMYYGEAKMLMNPSWYDEVIYNPITASEFEYNENKSDYFLYFGRVIETKGLHIAIQATEKAGAKLVIAGPGSIKDMGYNVTPSHVTEVGVCDSNQRRELMKRARAIIGPTYYVEPFGNMVVEGYMSGTPAITTDWGGFTENVVHGVTGYRCREMRDFVNAIKNIDKIDPKACRKWAIENCDDEVVHKKFNDYFNKLKEINFYRE